MDIETQKFKTLSDHDLCEISLKHRRGAVVHRFCRQCEKGNARVRRIDMCPKTAQQIDMDFSE